ncbi:hypothetical protein, conserved [Angomonas deanei]|uniref:Uncharacterized protein n=1 Tax=Angomonas deanei TaxID=59799 RepID=A0A7G2CN55_9TRYP|nr:hypothetical protein, conserved [Angomonas deanei]
MMYGKLPGTAFWKGSFINSERKSLTDVSQVLNDFFYYVWYTGGTDDGAPYVPAGRLYIGGARLEGSRETRLDMDPNPNDPTVAGEQTVKTAQRMVLLCESQEYKRGDYTVSSNQKKSTQPWFVQGWEDDTWIQTNWYIIFAPIAGVILLLIIIVTIYCLCLRRANKRPHEPLNPMVLRERVGKGYTYEDDSDEDGMGYYADYNQNQGYVDPGNTRVGRGFSRPNQGNTFQDDKVLPSAYHNSNNPNQHGDVGGDDDEEFPEGRSLNEEGRLRENGPPSDNRAPTVRRRAGSARRGARRTDSNTFSEVEVPTAGEIDEKNIDLGGRLLNEEKEKEKEKTEPEPPAENRAPTVRRRSGSARKGVRRTASSTFSEIEVPTAGEIDELNIDL